MQTHPDKQNKHQERPGRRLALAAALIALASVAGCGGGTLGDDKDKDEDATPVKFTRLAQDSNSGITYAAQLAVRDQASWTQLWTQHTAGSTTARPQPTVDFAGGMVIAVFLGPKSSGCQKAVITDVLLREAQLTVEYREEAPSQGTACTTVISHPSDIVSIPFSAGKVEFVKK